MVTEVAPQQGNEGHAIERLLRVPEFKGGRLVFIGDDVTDEDGVAVFNALHGMSVRVGRDRLTEARFALGNVVEVRELLRSILENNRAYRASLGKHGDQS